MPASRGAPMTVRADGITWPLQTYCDAYRMTSVDTFDLPRLDGTVRVIVLDDSGVESEPLWADRASWHDTLAYRLLASPPEPCFWCGSSPIVAPCATPAPTPPSTVADYAAAAPCSTTSPQPSRFNNLAPITEGVSMGYPNVLLAVNLKRKERVDKSS